MSGGLGRALGAYDEMYFRSMVKDHEPIYSVVGLDTEGTTIDFQVGANAYLYGTRFITYLAQAYGNDKVRELYSRSDSSRVFYAAQFRQVYGKSVYDAWAEWTEFERQFQKNNLEKIRRYPVTDFTPVTEEPLGSFSNIGYDAAGKKVYAAVNHPGEISQVAELDLKTGKLRKIATLDSPMLYSVTFLAYDPHEKKVFVSEQNNKYRSLVQIDVKSGRKKKLIGLSRTGNLVINPADRSLWGIKHDNGYATLVKIPEPYQNVLPMYTAEFGRSLLDPAVSNDGKMLVATLTGIRGEQSLVLFDLEKLEAGVKEHKTVFMLEDNTLTQFRFSADDRSLIGCSYYTGVSNIWRITLEDKRFELLSNDETGLFMPQQIGEDSLFVLQFHRHGMLPGIIPVRVIEDANAIDYLGNAVVERSPEVIGYSLPPASVVNLDSLKIAEAPYIAINNMSLSGAYPNIAGYKNTISLGYRMNWRDRIGLSNVNLFVAGSPWSPYPDKQKLHLQLRWDYWLWTFHAAYNETNFYDLFGPTRRSRAGYSVGINHHKLFARRDPFKWHYGFGITHYGDLEVLPGFQNIETPIRNFQSFHAETGFSKLRRSLGGVDDERGYAWNLTAYSYYAGGSLYPSLISEQSAGFLLPFMRNTCFWLRNSIGQAFGKRESSFSNFYFGGFRNNYVDWQPPAQYRKVPAFPGADIDALGGHNFIKTMGELNLRPLRLRGAGTTWIYPTYIRTSFFGTHLMLDPDLEAQRRHVFNTGIQIDIEVVLFSYMKTTWSAGYARKYEESLWPQDQWMFSVRLLGN